MCDGEVRMWRAIIKRAIADVIDSNVRERERKEAFDWICQGGRYFERACDCANVTPNAVRMELLKKRICKANRNT
ncbi:hypothetical protein FACS1894122_09190 [Alphaproteobacteria bacterium]|nr:hypothetical protein FACS1894122_09190 [Alphaproteobacteria bacterium]